MRNKNFIILGYIVLIIVLMGGIGAAMQDIGIVKFNTSYCNIAVTILSFIGLIAAVIYYIIDNYYR